MRHQWKKGTHAAIHAAMEAAITECHRASLEWLAKHTTPVTVEEVKKHFAARDAHDEEVIDEAIVNAIAEAEGIPVTKARLLWAELGATVDQFEAQRRDEQAGGA